MVLGADSSMGRAETAAKLLSQGFSGWSIGPRPDLAAFHSAPSGGPPANLRDEVCGKHRGNDEDEPPRLAGVGFGSDLAPRIAVGEPVTVFTGKADASLPGNETAAADAEGNGPEPAKAEASVKERPVKRMPLPRVRPQFPTGSAFDERFDPKTR